MRRPGLGRFVSLVWILPATLLSRRRYAPAEPDSGVRRAVAPARSLHHDDLVPIRTSSYNSVTFSLSIRIVRHQSFWDRELRHLREALARLVVDVMRLADDAASGGFGLSVV